MKLDIIDVTKEFRGQRALEEVSFHIPNCRTIAFLGSSGSGKSTLLRMIAGLEIPDRGTIVLDDSVIYFEEEYLLQHRRNIGVVFQSYNLFPHFTVLQNIELPLSRVHGLSLGEATDRAMEFLTRFSLQEHAFKMPYQLSGGERQRVSIVRAVAIKAQLILLDEPTSALDPLMTAEVLDLIYELREQGRSILIVSHNIGFVRKIADWVVFLNRGRVLEYGPTPRFFSQPSTPEARHFLEKVLKY